MIHNTTCHLDFNEKLQLRNLQNDVDYLRLFIKDVMMDNLQPNTLSDTLCKIIDKISDIKENKEIYPIFDKIDKLAIEVRKLPK